jgi:hypothetical protein
VLDRGGGVPAEVATAEHGWPDAGIQQALQENDAAGAGADVLEEPYLPARPEHAEGLAQRRIGVGDGAQREGEDGGVQASVRGGQPFREAVGDVDSDRGLPGGGLGEVA